LHGGTTLCGNAQDIVGVAADITASNGSNTQMYDAL
jgi:hypothetical protein